MAKFIVTAPDGKEYEITAPEGATQEQVIEYAKSQFAQQAADPRMDMRAGRGTNRAEGDNVAPKRPSTTADYLKSQAASLAAGAFDPVAGAEQLVLDPRNITPIGRIMQLVDIGVGKLTGEQRGQAGALQRQQERDVSVNELREQAGREGWDVSRIMGSIANPMSLYMGRGIPTGSLAQTTGYGATMGTLSGASAPLSGETKSFVEDKLFQAGFGGLVGGAVPLTVASVKKVAQIIRELPISESNKTRALQEYIVDKAGDNREAVIKALREVDEIVPGSKPTVADALADTPSGVGLIKEQQRVAATQKQGPKFLGRASEREAARQAELTGTFGTADDIAAARTLRQQETAPLREQALNQANVYGQTAPRLEQEIAERVSSAQQATQGMGRTATEAAQAQGRADRWTPVPGQPRFPGRYSPNAERAIEYRQAAQEFGDVATQRKAEAAFKQMQLKSLKDEGFYPLESKPLIDRINKSLTTPGERSNAILVDAQSKLRDRLAQFTDENGIINSRDLYNIRKGITDDIQQYLTNTKGNASMTTEAANVEKALKKQLDAAITQASGTGAWDDYLKNYAQYSQKIDRMTVGQALKAKLGEGSLGDVEKAGTFATAVQNAPQLIKRTTGAQRYEKLEDFLTPEQTASVNRVFADLSRSKKAADLAKQIEKDAPDVLRGAEGINVLDRYVTVFKSAMESLRRGSQDKFDAKVAELMADPQKLALFIESIPKKDAANVATAMYAKMSPQMQQAFQQYFPTATSVQSGVITQTVRD
jgi:hypothetical protein